MSQKSKAELEKQAAELNLRYLGSFATGDAIMLSDPSFAKREWDQSEPARRVVFNCPEGRWHVFLRRDPKSLSGPDVPTEILACHELCLDELATGISRLSFRGEVTIESGLIAFFDLPLRDEPGQVDELHESPAAPAIVGERAMVSGTGGDGVIPVSTWRIDEVVLLISAQIYERIGTPSTVC